MRTMSKIACCFALFLSVNTLSAYYYHSGYYDREGCCEYNDINCDESYNNCDDCNTCGYQSYWYQGSLNPFAYLMYNYYNSPYGTSSQAPPLSGTDNYTADKVRAALSRNKSVSNISVYVQNGRVTLTGQVENSAQKTWAASAAKKVSGVSSVNNQIVISR